MEAYIKSKENIWDFIQMNKESIKKYIEQNNFSSLTIKMNFYIEQYENMDKYIKEHFQLVVFNDDMLSFSLQQTFSESGIVSEPIEIFSSLKLTDEMWNESYKETIYVQSVALKEAKFEDLLMHNLIMPTI